MFEFWALNALWALNLQCQKFRASSSVAIFLDHHGFPGIYIYIQYMDPMGNAFSNEHGSPLYLHA